MVQKALEVTSVGFVYWDCIPLPSIAVGAFTLVPVEPFGGSISHGAGVSRQEAFWPELCQLYVFSLGSES